MHIKTTYYGFSTKVLASALVIAFASSGWVSGQESPPLAASKIEKPANRNLDATLYVQTAAEYRASCYQAYNVATARLDELAKANAGKFAVVMDLDETVLDNSRFQAMLLKNKLAWDKDLWALWEGKFSNQVTLIPGAKEFIEKAASWPNVEVFFVSNRNVKFKAQTKQALSDLGIPLKDDDHLKLTDPSVPGSSDKTKRFGQAETECQCQVLLYIGDNLRDFSDTLRGEKIEEGNPTDEKLDAAIKARKDALDKVRNNLGKDWIILPNPTYGEWKAPKGPLDRGQRDFDRLTAATFPVPSRSECNLTFLFPLIIIVCCVIWTLLHWPKEIDLGEQPAERAKLREFLVLDIRAVSQYCYWYLALIGVIAAIVAANKSYFAPILTQRYLWPFGLSFFAASLCLLFFPAGYGPDRARNLRFVWLRSALCEQIVVVFTFYGVWEAFRALTSTVP